MTFQMDRVIANKVALAASVGEIAGIAELVAQGTARRCKDSDYRNSIVVKPTALGARVGTDNSFAHLDEWGSVNNPPTGAMRSAAAEIGRFVPS